MREFEDGKAVILLNEYKSSVELPKRGPSTDTNKLAAQVHLLNKRLTNLEESFQKLSLSVSLLAKGTFTSNDLQKQTQTFDMSEAGKTAVAVIDHDLITNQPRTRNFFENVVDSFVVVKRYNFALLQCLLICVAIALALVFGFVQFLNAQSSVNDIYKPFKMEGIDDYSTDENLIYEIPYIYLQLTFYFSSSQPRCDDDDEDKDRLFKTCLERRIWNVFNMTEMSCNLATYNDSFSYKDFPLRKVTVYVDEMPHAEDLNEFGALVKLDFNNVERHSPGKYVCVVVFDLELFIAQTAGFDYYHSFDFMVSREELNSGFSGFATTDHWFRTFPIEQYAVYDYYFEESRYDEKLDITADLVLNSWGFDNQLIAINVICPTSVKKYSSYHRYSYLDFLADLGGCLTLVTSFFFVLITRVTKFANRKQSFHLKQGILPVFSQQYRNAEEIAGLRAITMAGFGITEEDYFSTSRRL